MQSIARLLLALLLVPILPCVAAEKKKPKATIRFFIETSANDGEKFSMPVEFHALGRKGFVSKIALINETDITHVHVFPTSDGSGTWGCYFFLDDHGVIAVDAASIEKRGKAIVATVNGRRVCEMLIDKRITDGVIAIPTGLTPAEMGTIAKAFKPKFAPKKAG